jgi:hypothetical protein
MFAKHSLVRSLVVVAGVAAVWAGGAGRASAQTQGVYVVSQVTGFQQMIGNFGASNLQRVRGTAIAIGANRTFAIALPNTWYGVLTTRLVPVPGQRNLFYFSVSRTLNTGVGVNAAFVEGVVLVNANGTPVAMRIHSRAGNNVAAVVNNRGFSAGVSNEYQAVVNLRRR